jgi:hypothetical protein
LRTQANVASDAAVLLLQNDGNGNGLDVSGHQAIHVASATTEGMSIDHAGTHGLLINASGQDRVRLIYSARNGVFMQQADIMNGADWSAVNLLGGIVQRICYHQGRGQIEAISTATVSALP